MTKFDDDNAENKDDPIALEKEVDIVEQFLAKSVADDSADYAPDLNTPEGHRSGFIAVVGRPNVGKSTLINAILDEKIAIVSPKPQTTRIRQLGILTKEEAQVIFIDTPGIHKPQHSMGAYMVQVAVNALKDADIILFVTDASTSLKEEDKNVANMIKEAGSDLTVIRVLNKVDLAKNPEQYQETVDAQLDLVPYTEWATTVATKGKGVDELLDILLGHLPEGPRFYPPNQVSDLWTRDIASEMIREAALHLTEQEIPHAIAVTIEEFKERKNGVIYIAASLFVERDSQKPIIIGKGGKMIKRISSKARQEIENFLETQIYLELQVKVMKNWRSDDNALRRLGYDLPQ